MRAKLFVATNQLKNQVSHSTGTHTHFSSELGFSDCQENTDQNFHSVN